MDLFALLNDALLRKDYQQAANLLWIPINKSHLNPFIGGLPAINQNQNQNQTFSTPLNEAGPEHLKCLAALQSHQAIGIAFKHECEALQQLVRHPLTRLELPLLKRLVVNVYNLARAADLEGLFSTSCTTFREEATRLLSKVFTFCLTDRSMMITNRRWAALGLAQLLFRLYFSLGTIRLAGNIARAIDNTRMGGEEFPPLEELPKADVVSYIYYRARIALQKGEWQDAEELLLEGLKFCPSRFSQQKELIIYLITTRIIRGKLPQIELLNRHQLNDKLGPLVEAVRTGNLTLFEQTLQTHQQFFMRKELYLLFQLHLRNLILRTLFKKIYGIGLKLAIHQENRINLVLLEKALCILGQQDIEIDEVECLVANLIVAVYNDD